MQKSLTEPSSATCQNKSESLTNISLADTLLTRLFTGLLTKPRVLCFICLTIIFGYRILCLFQPHLLLFFDEAYYYHWSQIPDWGYYSKPPMVAWLIHVSTLIFGTSTVSVKLFSPLLYALSGWLVYLMAEKLHSTKAGIYSCLAFSLTPIVGFNSEFITTDAPLFFFWALSSYLFLLAIEQKGSIIWILLGISIGFGMLSKYSFVLLPLGFFLYLLICRNGLPFKNPMVYFGAAIALGIFSTNLYWNYEHGFIAFNHTKEIAKLDKDIINVYSLIQFLATQLLLFSPSLLVFIHAGKSELCALSKKKVYFLLATMLPILGAIGLQAFLSRAFANWAAPFVVSACIFAGIAMTGIGKKPIAIGLSINALLLSAFYHWPYILHSFGIEESPHNSPYQRIAGWDSLAEKFNQHVKLEQRPDKVNILSDSRDILAYMGFYNQIPVQNLIFWNPDPKHIQNHYDLINNLRIQNPATTEVIFISKNEIDEAILSRFKSTKYLGQIATDYSSIFHRQLFSYKLSGFKGYQNNIHEEIER